MRNVRSKVNGNKRSMGSAIAGSRAGNANLTTLTNKNYGFGDYVTNGSTLHNIQIKQING